MARIINLLWTDPDNLLEDGTALLHEDFEQLGASSSTNKELWVTSMEAALLAVGHVRQHREKRRTTAEDNDRYACSMNTDNKPIGKLRTLSHDDSPPMIDNEGSLQYCTRKWK